MFTFKLDKHIGVFSYRYLGNWRHIKAIHAQKHKNYKQMKLWWQLSYITQFGTQKILGAQNVQCIQFKN